MVMSGCGEHLDLLNQLRNLVITDASTISEGNVNTTDPSGDTDQIQMLNLRLLQKC